MLSLPQMKIIIGQGNPESQYDTTRHNVGFAAIDRYAHEKGVSFQTKSKFESDIGELSRNDEKILLVKPLTYYNETGRAARALADFYKLDSSDILVIHDELALPFGTLRSRDKGRDAGNNGIKSLNAHLGENYARIRVGIWNEIADRQGAFDFVLSKFTSEEVKRLDSDILPKIVELIDDFIDGNHTTTSHTL
jgi:peptidyl-tRNA hydrolase, PTH1 family